MWAPSVVILVLLQLFRSQTREASCLQDKKEGDNGSFENCNATPQVPLTQPARQVPGKGKGGRGGERAPFWSQGSKREGLSRLDFAFTGFFFSFAFLQLFTETHNVHKETVHQGA